MSHGTIYAQKISAIREQLVNKGRLSKERFALERHHYGYMRLNSAPFPHPQRKQKTSIYNDNRVAFFVPSTLDPKKEFYFLVYLHGWYNNVENVLSSERLPNQILDSGKNVILLVPELARDTNDSFGGKFENVHGFADFMTEVRSSLAKDYGWSAESLNRGKVIVAAHSGGYSPLMSILTYGGEPVQAAYLFDGLYGPGDRFFLWKHFNPTSKMAILYTDNGGTTKFSKHLTRTLKSFRIIKDFRTMELPSAEITKKQQKVLKNHSFLIIDTGSTSHHRVVEKGYLSLLLKAL